MQRIPHNETGFWLKEFKYIKSNPDVKKYYLDSASYLNYSINIKLDEEDNLVFTMPGKVPETGIADVYFGQQFSPQRNIELYTKFYFDQDLSINRAGLYNTFSEATSETGKAQILHLNGDTLENFYLRNGYESDEATTYIPALSDFYELYFGYARIQNFKPEYTSLNDYEALSSPVIASMDDSCFKWIKIVDGVLEKMEEEDYKSSALVVDFKMTVDLFKMKQWILDNFSDKLFSMINKISTRTIDFNFMFYPPSSTGMQLEDTPVITSPMGVLKTKILKTVEFEIKRSLVNNSQKVFEIYFVDNKDMEVIYGDNSLESSQNFSLITKSGVLELKSFIPENGVFEDLSQLDFPVNKFTVKYTLKDDLVKFLSNHLNYTILIKVTDLTSERRQ